MISRLFINARIVDADKDIPLGWLTSDAGFISGFDEGEYGDDTSCFDEIIDCKGNILMPGVIDEHVHFREPGMESKGDIASESRAAAAGGVTTFFDMPNTYPATTSMEAWKDKMARASRKSLVNYAFYLGATDKNILLLHYTDYANIPGIKLFMGASTGTGATGNYLTKKLYRLSTATVAVHAEDDSVINENLKTIKERYPELPVKCHSMIRNEKACLKASLKIIGLAYQFKCHTHIMHVSTAAEVKLLKEDWNYHKGIIKHKIVTSETCPQYLFFDTDKYEELGSRMKCNPSIKSSEDREALVEAVFSGVIDTVATDHAPHLPADKEGNALTAASGMPGVQFSLLLMLELAIRHNKSCSDVSRLMSANPADVWRVKRRGRIRQGYYSDLVIVAPTEPYAIDDSHVLGKCGWTPYRGIEVSHKVLSTWVNGEKVFDCEKGIIETDAAMAVTFDHINPWYDKN